METHTFTLAETNLMVIYSTGTRLGLLTELGNMLTFVSDDETELRQITVSVIHKLQQMKDKDFNALDLEPDILKGR
jgi:hypothetical protein